jgi:F0F1-type ATP synthase assembly protein I
MDQQDPAEHDSDGDGTTSGDNGPPGGDPMLALSYLISGIGVYGLIGWGLSRWLHADYLTPLGIVVGAFFGMYLVVVRFVRQPPDGKSDPATQLRHTRPDRSESAAESDERQPTDMPDFDDRGDTA